MELQQDSGIQASLIRRKQLNSQDFVDRANFQKQCRTMYEISIVKTDTSQSERLDHWIEAKESSYITWA
jgi:hypothetical protein